jgi:DNA-binding MarR family transcriptional regulator
MLRIQRELRAFDASFDRLDAAAACELRIGRNDLRAIELVSRQGRLPAGILARRLALTSGAMTSLLDRMGRRGFLRCTEDPDDRRRVIVHVTGEGRRRLDALLGGSRRERARSLAGRSLDELQVIEDFLIDARQVAERARHRLEGDS